MYQLMPLRVLGAAGTGAVRAMTEMNVRAIKRLIFLAAAGVVLMLASQAHAQTVSYKTADVDGLKIFYREAGDPAKPTILLLHGFPSSSHMFRDLIPLLAQDFHVLAPDYPGMGHSEAPKGTSTFDTVAQTIGKFTQQLGEKRMIVYMQDFGGPVGMRLALEHPRWIAGLIIQNTPLTLSGFDPARLKLLQALSGPVTAEKRAEAGKRVTLATAQFLYQHGARNPSALNPDAWTNDALALDSADGKRVMTDLLIDVASNLERYPAWKAYLHQEQPKTLIVWGKSDPQFLVATVTDVQKEVPGAEIHYYDTGHFALEEDSLDIAHQIIHFFAR